MFEMRAQRAPARAIVAFARVALSGDRFARQRHRLASCRRLLPIQVLASAFGSGKTRLFELFRMKELDSENRLSANFIPDAT